MTLTKDQIKNFWAKVDRRSDAECWEWRGCYIWSGYGRYVVWHGKKQHNLRAHRLAYQLTHGYLAADQCVCHKCDNRKCVNPTHLWLGDRAANLADMTQKGRRVRGERSGTAKLTERDVLRIRELRSTGKPLPQIAAMFGIAFQTVSSIALGKTWKHLPCYPVVSKPIRHRGRLDSHDVDEIRRLRSIGFSQQTIAELFDVCQTHISRVCRGIHWKELVGSEA